MSVIKKEADLASLVKNVISRCGLIYLKRMDKSIAFKCLVKAPTEM